MVDGRDDLSYSGLRQRRESWNGGRPGTSPERKLRWSEGETRAAGDGAERGGAGGLWSRPAEVRGYAQAGGADSGGFGGLRVTVWI